MEDVALAELGFSEPELAALLSDEKEPDWDQFDSRLAMLENDVYVLLPIKIRPSAKEPAREALRAHATQLGIRHKDEAALAGRVVLTLLGV